LCFIIHVVDYLVVAGGGGGGAGDCGPGSGSTGGGGGAGGYRELSNQHLLTNPLFSKSFRIRNYRSTVSVQGYPITVGGGGTAGQTGAIAKSRLLQTELTQYFQQYNIFRGWIVVVSNSRIFNKWWIQEDLEEEQVCRSQSRRFR
jgi:hypothetical protein